MSDDATTDATPVEDDVAETTGGVDDAVPADETVLTVESLLDDLDRVTAERDVFLDDSRRIAADFANFRRQTEKRNVANTAVAAMVDTLIRNAFANDGGAKAVHFPSGPAEVHDEAGLRVVVLDYNVVAVTQKGAEQPPAAIVEMLDKVGSVGSPRTYRNAVVFAVPDEEQVEVLKDRARALIASNNLASDTARLTQFSDEVRKKVEVYNKEATLNARIAVTRCYKHVYYPVKDASSDHLAHRELPAAQKGDTAKSVVRTVRELLVNEGKVRTEPIPTNWLKQRAWDKPESTTTKKVVDWFWRDQAALLLLDPTLLTDAIKKGIANDGWVYYDTITEKAYSATSATPAIQLADTAELYTAEEAAVKGILGRAPSLGDVLASVSPATTARMVAKATAEMKPRKTLPPTAFAR